ncbi:unnamed protein product [Urochloa humidicola]
MENFDKYGLHQAGPMVYTTKNMEGIVSWWQSRNGFFTQVDAFVIVSTLLFSIEVVLGWWRRCSSHALIKYPLWLAYICTPLATTYTLGLINSYLFAAHNIKDLPKEDAAALAMWSLSLVIALGSTYSMTAYDIDDNKQYMRHLVRHALYVLNSLSLIKFCINNSGIKFPMAWVVFVLVSLFWPPRISMAISGMMASSSSDKASLYLHDYMQNEHLKSTSYNPVTLEGYNYLIIWKTGKPNPIEITVSQVWASNQGILCSSGSRGTKLKEICLSFALSRLLRQRFFGAAWPEAALAKAHELVFRGLLSNVDENYQFAYRVIEAELAFTYDHFFTTSPCLGLIIIFHGIGKVCIYLILLSVVCAIA